MELVKIRLELFLGFSVPAGPPGAPGHLNLAETLLHETTLTGPIDLLKVHRHAADALSSCIRTRPGAHCPINNEDS